MYCVRCSPVGHSGMRKACPALPGLALQEISPTIQAAYGNRESANQKHGLPVGCREAMAWPGRGMRQWRHAKHDGQSHCLAGKQPGPIGYTAHLVLKIHLLKPRWSSSSSNALACERPNCWATLATSSANSSCTLAMGRRACPLPSLTIQANLQVE